MGLTGMGENIGEIDISRRLIWTGEMGWIVNMVVGIGEVLRWRGDMGGKGALGGISGMGKPSLGGVDVYLQGGVPESVPGKPCLQAGAPVLEGTAVLCSTHLGLLVEHLQPSTVAQCGQVGDN